MQSPCWTSFHRILLSSGDKKHCLEAVALIGPYGQIAEATSPTAISSQMIVPTSDTVMSRGHVIILVGKGIGLVVAVWFEMVNIDVNDVNDAVDCADKVEEETIVEIDEI